jgi:hypothetical protein
VNTCLLHRSEFAGDSSGDVHGVSRSEWRADSVPLARDGALRGTAGAFACAAPAAVRALG